MAVMKGKSDVLYILMYDLYYKRTTLPLSTLFLLHTIIFDVHTLITAFCLLKYLGKFEEGEAKLNKSFNNILKQNVLHLILH